MRYVSLHHHSTFSYLDGFQMPETHVARAAELGMSALALTEHGNVSSHVKLEIAAQKQGIKPIFGCELYTGAVDDERSQRKNHLTVLAETQEGYQNLLRVVSQGWSDFYHEPTVSGETLARFRKGLVVLSGCTGSLLATSLVGGKNIREEEASYKRARKVARRFKRTLGEGYYLEVQAFPELGKVCQINQAYAEISRDLGIPLVATGDVHYTRPSESDVQQILHNVRGGNRQTLEEQARAWGYDVPLSPPVTDKEIYRRLRATGLSKMQAWEAIDNTALIAERCTVEIPKLPKLRYPHGPKYSSPYEVWEEWLQRGWEYRGIHRLSKAEQKRYREKLNYERSIIEEKDFIDYFLIVSDIVRFAKNSNIGVGPARGSAAASLACYLLRITEVDPMLYPNLVFERFIDITREDLPDIDLDFDSDQRDLIREYAIRKYGRECVGNIGTFTYYKAKLSLDDVARVFRIPQSEVEVVKDVLIERSSGDLRASATIEDTVEQFENAADVFQRYPDLKHAMDLEGNIKGMGVHAAGLIVANGPLTDVCATYERRMSDGRVLDVISLDKWDAERQNLVKIDILGLSTMSMLGAGMRMLDMTVEDLYAIPFDDEKIIEGFRRNDVVGIFQFDGRAMRSVNYELKPDTFKEICDINALARPGPLHNGATAEYIDIKHGRKQPTSIHPLLDNITQDTNFQIVYQEQILRIVKEIGNFDWTHAAYIRKIISKKLGEQEFARQFERFWDGAQANGMDKDTAQRIWSMCITAGSYAFNAAHSVSYGMLAWWTMWLKVYHPEIFYVASLQKMPESKHHELLKDADRHEIGIHAPDPCTAGLTWGLHPDGIQGGLMQVRGIGEKLAMRIIEYRDEHGGFDSINQMLEVPGVGQAKLDAITAMSESDDPYGVFRLRRLIDRVKAELPEAGLPIPTHNSAEVPYSRGQDMLVIWLGVITHRNLRDLFEFHYSKTGEELSEEDVKDPHLKEWVVMLGTDDEEVLSITVDRWKYPKFKRAIWGLRPGKDLVLIKGVKKGFQARRAIYVQDIWVIDPEEEE